MWLKEALGLHGLDWSVSARAVQPLRDDDAGTYRSIAESVEHATSAIAGFPQQPQGGDSERWLEIERSVTELATMLRAQRRKASEEARPVRVGRDVIVHGDPELDKALSRAAVPVHRGRGGIPQFPLGLQVGRQDELVLGRVVQ